MSTGERGKEWLKSIDTTLDYALLTIITSLEDSILLAQLFEKLSSEQHTCICERVYIYRR